MAGLQLRTGFSAGGSYTPLTPASAQPSTSDSSTIGQQAYGISGSGVDPGGSSLAAYGSVATGLVALLGLVYLWWSLPR